MPQELFTIGHSNHELPRLLELLRAHAITAIADVRSEPYSQYTPQFNREVLEQSLKQAGVQYVFLGVELGARRAELGCYVNGRAEYGRIAKLPLFAQGLERVRRGAQTHRVALMCSEKDPITCHRTILVCRNLRDTDRRIAHILEDGTIETHEAAERRLMDEMGVAAEDLFCTAAERLEQAYDMQAAKIAYVTPGGRLQGAPS